jgi:hypothetical protein
MYSKIYIEECGKILDEEIGSFCMDELTGVDETKINPVPHASSMSSRTGQPIPPKSQFIK